MGQSRRRWLGGANTEECLAQCVLVVCVYVTNLALEEDSSDAVEQLERRYDVALYQHARTQRSRHPPPSTYGHLVEPLLEWEATHPSHPALQHVRHGRIGALGSGLL